MATDAVENSSYEEISFSEWQFVDNHKGDCSDDESIEIIEREVLQSVTPSSCSEDEDENNDEVEITDWEVPIENETIHLDDEESIIDSLLEIDTDQAENDFLYTSEDNHVAVPSINNHFSRKVLYSCVLAAVIGVVVHQYRGNLLDVLNRVYAKPEVNEPSPQEAALYMETELKQQPTDHKFLSDDAIIQDLADKREQFKKLCEKYDLILSNTFTPKSNIYAIELSILRKILLADPDSLDTLNPAPCETDIDKMQLPELCTDSSGKPLLFMGKQEYNDLMGKILNTMQFDENKIHESLDHLIRKHSKDVPVELTDIENEIVDEISISKPDEVDHSINNNVMTLTSNKPSEARERNSAVKLNIQELYEEIRILSRDIRTQVADIQRLLNTCNKNEQNSYRSKNELVPELNDTSEKMIFTYDEEPDPASVSEFIYKSAPITDRWSLKMNSEPSEDSKHHDKSTEDWILKMGKAREKYRKRYKDKGKKKPHKSYDKTVDEIYKRYKEFVSKTSEKIKVDYKKFSSQFKSKLKKIGDGMKRSYEKIISSDWKHYARSVFPFRF